MKHIQLVLLDDDFFSIKDHKQKWEYKHKKSITWEEFIKKAILKWKKL